MSIAIQTIVWQHYRASGGELLLALKLADCANDDGSAIFMKVETMAGYTRQSPRAVQVQLRRMEESGFLVVIKHASGGRGHAREYSVNPKWLANPTMVLDGMLDSTSVSPYGDSVETNAVHENGVKGADGDKIKGADGDKIKGADSAPFSAKGCSLKQERVHTAAPFIEPPYIRNPSLPIPLTPNDCEPNGFKLFWQSWPVSPHKKRKTEARRVWVKGKLEAEFELILKHLHAVIVGSEQAVSDGGKYLRAPHRYLADADWREWQLKPDAAKRVCAVCGAPAAYAKGGVKLCKTHFEQDED